MPPTKAVNAAAVYTLSGFSHGYTCMRSDQAHKQYIANIHQEASTATALTLADTFTQQWHTKSDSVA